MATEAARATPLEDIGAAELTQLGKRIEILRIERGCSKQQLARHAGTSRQQLWRVMTGKSELTTALRDRLAAALAVDVALLAHGESIVSGAAIPVGDYLTEPHHLAATLRTLPAGDGGRRLKRALLNALEDLAVETSRVLPIDYAEIHRRVLAGEL
ncbi:MAG: helix-turn-helix transcriptional regulator [Polaromonas sp.]|nr:helix-turn-helix transcriptional regulator [Gemmatimonadaceae bacterium]